MASRLIHRLSSTVRLTCAVVGSSGGAAASCTSAASSSESLPVTAGKGYDFQQVKYLSDSLILVNGKDEYRGSASKYKCHQWKHVHTGDVLHRAFSVFLFNNKEELLLQKRSAQKITFPGMWTNACCSHPLHVDEELSLHDQAIGIRRAAVRKLSHELGFLENQVPVDSLEYITRILYKSRFDAEWGEHELDYVLIVRSDALPLPNKNEVETIKYVNRHQLRQMLERSRSNPNLKFTPWFELIARHFLYRWWDNLERLDSVKDQDTIHDFVSKSSITNDDANSDQPEAFKFAINV